MAPSSLGDWPVILRPYVKALGVSNVWFYGMRALGFPPTWITAGHELGRLLSYIEKDTER